MALNNQTSALGHPLPFLEFAYVDHAADSLLTIGVINKALLNMLLNADMLLMPFRVSRLSKKQLKAAL